MQGTDGEPNLRACRPADAASTRSAVRRQKERQGAVIGLESGVLQYTHSFTMISCGDALQVVVYNQRLCTQEQAFVPRR